MTEAWRICQKRHAHQAFLGTGAKKYGGRWNPPGVPLVYTSSTRALAAMEVLVHVEDRIQLRRRMWVAFQISIADDLIEEVGKLPVNWQQYPSPVEIQDLGAVWAKSMSSVVLRVPSAVVGGEWNYLINPLHPQFKRLKIGTMENFHFDPRFAK